MYEVTRFGFVLKASSQDEKKILLKIQKLGWVYGFTSIEDFLKMKKPHPHKSDAINTARFNRVRSGCLKLIKDSRKKMK